MPALRLCLPVPTLLRCLPPLGRCLREAIQTDGLERAGRQQNNELTVP